MIRRLEYSMLGVLLLAVSPTFLAAKAPSNIDSPAGAGQPSAVDIEVRTLKQGSPLRVELESKLGKNRVAPGLQIQVRADSSAWGGQSLVDLMEASIRAKTDWDPYADPIEPNGPGSYSGQTQATHVNCASVNIGGSSQPGNITWNWTYTANNDTNGDGRINNKDNCPCSWTLTAVVVELHTESGPLDC